jgi:microcystin-dependent protein
MSQIPPNQGAIKSSEIATDSAISAIGSTSGTDLFSVVGQIQQLALDAFFKQSLSPFSLGELFWDGTQVFFNQNGRGNNLMVRVLQTQDASLRTIDLMMTGSNSGNTATTFFNIPLNNNDLMYLEIDRATLLSAPGGILTIQNNASGGSLVAGKTLKVINMTSSTGLPQLTSMLDGTGTSLYIPIAYRYDWTDGVTNFQDLNWAINRERWPMNTISYLGTPVAGGIEPTGTGLDFWGPTAPVGYVMASGRTIGNAGTNASERANSDTAALFTLFWTNYSDATLPMYTNSGFPQARGASAAADFAASMLMTIPDKRGRVSVGKDDMGGTAANRITAGGSGVPGTTLGGAGGEETHTLSQGEMPVHAHSVNDPSHAHNLQSQNGGGGNPGSNYGTGANALTWHTAAAVTGISLNNAGGGAPHNNTQPTIICNYIIKL